MPISRYVAAMAVRLQGATLLGLDAYGLLLLLAGAVCISFAPILAGVAHMHPTGITFYRMLFGGLGLALFLRLRGLPLVPKGFVSKTNALPLALIVACAAFFTLDLECWHRSIQLVGPGLATILANFQVFFLAAWGVAMAGERPGPRLALAVPVALVGLWLLAGPRTGGEPMDARTLWRGLAYGLAAALFYAGYLLSLRRSQALDLKLPAVTNMALICLATALVILLGALVRGDGAEAVTIPGLRQGAVLLLYGLGPQAVGWVLISTGLPRLPASMGGLAILLQPTLAFTWDVVLLGRPAGPVVLVGAALAIGGILMGLTSRGFKQNKDAPAKKSSPDRPPHVTKP